MQLPARKKIEKDFTERMERLTGRHRAELVALLGSPVDPTKVPDSFWSRVEKEAEDETIALLLLLFGVGSRTAIRRTGGDFASNVDSLIGQADRYATERAKKVGKDYRVGAKDAFDKRSAEWEAKTDEGTPDPPTRKETAEDTEQVFGKTRAEKIAVDETTAAQFNGGEAGIRNTVGLSEQDRWHTRPWLSRSGPCKVCRGLNGSPRSVWSTRFPEGPGETVHPHCVCEIVYADEPAPTD